MAFIKGKLSVMNSFVLHIAGTLTKKETLLKRIINEDILRNKFDSVNGMILLSIAVIVLSLAITYAGFTLAVAAAGAIIGIPLVFAAMFNIRFGVFLIITISFFVLAVKKIASGVPLGLAMDVIISVMFLGIIIKQTSERDWSFAKNQISKIILIWIVYNLMQVANPTAESRLAYLYTVRSIAGFMVMFFIIGYAIDSRKMIRHLITLWLILATLAALYAIYQEHVGFMQFEINWIYADERRYRLLYIMGRIRKFSFFSDPAVFGLLMGYSSVLTFILAAGPFSKKIKALLFISGGLMILAMLYSGTRSAYVLPPAGLFFYAFMTFKKKVIISVAVFFFMGLVLILMPTSNVHIYRLQTAFKPSEDASYETRIRNQKFIQPFIQSHPLGGGLGSTGEWGKRFSPHSPLANFPPDSGYVRTAVELGWVGLLIYCSLLFVIFYQGIKNYFTIKDGELKTYLLGMLSVLFALALANYPQEATNQLPTSLLFFVAVAIISRIKDFDGEQNVK